MVPQTTSWRVLGLALLALPVWSLPDQAEAQLGRRNDGTPILAGELCQGQPLNLAGARFEPGADLNGVDCSGADLTGAVLRQVSLRGAELAGAILVGADFTGAELGEAEANDPEGDLPLPPDRSFEAETDPTDADADLSYFFAQGLPLGTVRELAVGRTRFGQPKHLFPTGDGLAWTTTQSDLVYFAFPHGLSVAGGQLAPAYVGWMPEKASLWLAAELGRYLYALPAKLFQKRGAIVHARPFGPLVLPPSDHAARTGGMVRSPNGLFHRLDDQGGICRFPSQWIYNCQVRPPLGTRHKLPSFRLPGLPLTGLVACDDGKVLCLAKDAVGFLESAQPLVKGRLPMARATGMSRAIGTPEGIWYSAPARNALCFVPYQAWSSAGAPGAGTCRTFPLGPSNRQVFDLVLGPDGCIWFTELLNSSIGRLDPASGAFLRFPLPIPGSRPAYLVNGGDGKLYFTQMGSLRLGSIAALEPAPSPLPSPEAPLLEAAPSEVPPLPPVPAPLPAARRERSALEALEDRCPGGVNWTHIHAEHRYQARTAKGQFLRALDGRERLAGLIDRCLADPLCPLFLTGEGKWMALRAFPEPVGYHLTQGDHWAPTNRMVVVLSPDRSYVVTAYPVGPNF